MAALSLKPGPGRPASNSFIVSVSEADTLVTELTNYAPNIATVWALLSTDDEKIAVLIRGAQAMRYMRWRGRPKYSNQALPFPRWITEIDEEKDTGIPDAVKRAQLFCAIYLGYKAISQYPAYTEELSDGTKAKRVSVAGMFDVEASDKPPTPADPYSGANLERLFKDHLWPVYMELTPYLVQMRITRVRTAAERHDERVAWTTTTSSTTTSTSTTTTTTTTTGS